MTREEILERLRKMKALADRGEVRSLKELLVGNIERKETE